MPNDPQPPSLAGLIRYWLGTDHIAQLEESMTSAVTELTDLRTAFAAYRSDVNAKLDQLLAAQGQLQPEAQAIFDSLKADVDAGEAEVGDADGSNNPPA